MQRAMLTVGLIGVLATHASAQSSAGNSAHVVIEGGPHAGVFDFASPSCTIATDPTGMVTLSMAESPGADPQHLQSLIVSVPDAKSGRNGSTLLRFMIGFGGSPLPPPPAVRYSWMRPTTVGSGTLTIRDDTTSVRMKLHATVGDSLKFTAEASCTKVHRRPPA
ncbi:MAG TPA: hypothetical protein VGM84_19660 [Steroidobacteraceae bacterium]|jgi:hypothetical protein